MEYPLETSPISRLSPSRFLPHAEKIAPFFMAMLIAYALVRSFCQASIKPFWYDEICTLILVHQERISTIWSALRDGADGQPPLFYLAERWFTPPIAHEHLALRTLSILGFAATILCLFFLIRKRRGNTLAMFCAAIPMVTILFRDYSVEARPYSVLSAFISFALDGIVGA